MMKVGFWDKNNSKQYNHFYSKDDKLLKTFYFSRGGCEYGKY